MTNEGESEQLRLKTVTISLVTANNKSLILDCLRSIYDTSNGVDFETYVVINASPDDSESAIRREFPDVKLIVNRDKLGFTHNHNMVMRRGEGKYVLVLNDDTVFLEGALRKMVDFMESSPQTGLLGCKILNTDRTLQWSCGKSVFPKAEYFRSGVLRSCFPFLPVQHFTSVTEVHWVTGACILARAEAIKDVGLFDENIVIYYEDGDWCYRMIRAGWKVVFSPDPVIIHLHGQTRKQHLARDLFIIYQSRFYFYGKHYGILGKSFARLFTLGEVILRYFATSFRSARAKGETATNAEVRRAYARVMALAVGRGAATRKEQNTEETT